MLSIAKSNQLVQALSSFLFKHDTTFNEYDLAFKMKHLNTTMIAIYLENLDTTFAHSSERINTYYIKQKRVRTFVTTLGTISFVRRQYKHKITGAYFYYVDSLLEFDPYQRVSNTLKFEILKMVTTTSYVKTAAFFGISKQAVFNFVSSLQYITFNPPSFQEKRTLKHLYIQADECYVSLQSHKVPYKKSNKLRVEEVTIHEGIAPVSKGRNKLINRTLFTRNAQESTQAFYHRIKSWIAHNYNYQHLYLYGDGASWITTCALTLNATFILDLFHTKQAIHRLAKDKPFRQLVHQLIHQNQFSAFSHLYTRLLEMNYPLTKLAHQSFNYIIKHWKHIQLNFSLPQSVGCSQEGINFHYFASRLTTFPRGWSKTNVRSIAGLLTLVHNHRSLHALQDILMPTIHSLESFSKHDTLGPHIPYTVIEALSDHHQFHKTASLHLPHFRLN